MVRSDDEIRKILKHLTQQAKDSGAGEYRALVDFLTDAFESEQDNNQQTQNLLIASCDEIIAYANFLKQELS